MREILFRGKDFSGVINHNWCFGCLDTTENDRVIIIYSDRFGNKCRVFVDPKTVGQYTGLIDKNGKKIFEGDILHFKAYRGGGFTCPIGTDIYYRVLFGHCNPDSNTLSEYVGFWALSKNYDEDDLYEYGNSIDYLVDSHGAYVIGNIHDNPELLKEE